MNYKQIKDKEQNNIARLEQHFGKIPSESGIYIFSREEKGFKYAYIGQAKNLVKRLAQHLDGYQHIDLSIKKHGLYKQDNPFGWYLTWLRIPEDKLDNAEQEYIRSYANAGFQLRNKTAGGQGEGKTSLENAKQPKTYTEGKAYGRKQALAEIKHIVDEHLVVTVKKDNKNDKKALDKFFSLINGE